MKVALILTGFMRNWEENYSSVKKEILDKYHPDVYISSYTYSRMYMDQNDRVEINPKKVIKEYQPKNYLFREFEDCPGIIFTENGSERFSRDYSVRQLLGWWTHLLAFNLFNFDDYDIIIKLRTDVAIANFKLHNTRFDELVLPAWKFHPGPVSPEEAYVDHIAYGNPFVMAGYFRLFEKMQEMHQKYIDISCGETLLKVYIQKYVTSNVHEDKDVDWKGRGGYWASEKATMFPITPTTVKDE